MFLNFFDFTNMQLILQEKRKERDENDYFDYDNSMYIKHTDISPYG